MKEVGVTPLPLEDHLSEAMIASAVEGNLTPWERRRVLRHLADCQRCTQELAEVHTALRETNLLPPIPLRHPLEEALGWLDLIAPLPAWVWQGVLLVLTCLAWLFLVNMSSVLWLRDPVYAFLPYLSVILFTAHFVWLQQQLRQLHTELWEIGVPRETVDAFQQRYLRPVQGWLTIPLPGQRQVTIGPLGTWLALTVVIQINNYIRLSSGADPYQDMLAYIIGFYSLLTTTIAQWGWLGGGYYLAGLGRLLRKQPRRISEALVGPARRLALGWLLVGIGSMIWFALASIPTGKINEPGVPVVILQVTAMLLVLWMGYLRLEVALMRERRSFRQGARVIVRLAVTLVLLLSPLTLQGPVRALVGGGL